MRNPYLAIASLAGIFGCSIDEQHVDAPRQADVDECGRTIPSCDDGTPAIVWERFGEAGSCDGNTSGGGSWNVFTDASEPARPVTEAIVRITDMIDDGYGYAGVSVNGQFGGLGVTDCGTDGSHAPCVNGTVVADPGEWYRWTIAGVNQHGPVVELSTSHDAMSWIKFAATDEIGLVFKIAAGTYCPMSGHPPVPCGTLKLELSDALYVCRSSL